MTKAFAVLIDDPTDQDPAWQLTPTIPTVAPAPPSCGISLASAIRACFNMLGAREFIDRAEVGGARGFD
jgi:hypothetical protein